MTFGQVVLRMLRCNVRRYVLSLLCQGFTVAVFYLYATVATDAGLLAAVGSDRTITYAPSLAIGVFGVLFFAYTYGSYLRFRSRDLGTFLILGMTPGETTGLVLLESLIVFVLSLALGLIAGSVLAWPFHLLIMLVVGVQGVSSPWTAEAYLYAAVFSGFLFVLASLFTVGRIRLDTVLRMLRRHREGRMGPALHPVWQAAGILLVVLSLVWLRLWLGTARPFVLPAGVGACVVGLYLSTPAVCLGIASLWNRRRGNPHRNLLARTNLRHSIASTRNLTFVVALLAAVSIFFAGVGASIISDAGRVSAGYHPYHVSFVQIGQMNAVPDGSLRSLLAASPTPLTVSRVLDFVLASGVVAVSDTSVTDLSGQPFDVQPGRFISLALVMLDDNHPHEEVALMHPDSLEIGGRRFESQASVTAVLFNRMRPLDGLPCAVLDSEDYSKIARLATEDSRGKLTLLSFSDWRRTEPFVRLLTSALYDHNLLVARTTYPDLDAAGQSEVALQYRPSSRIEQYLQLRQSAALTLYLFAFVGLLFLFASPTVLYLRLLLELPAEVVKYRKIARLGATAAFVARTIHLEIRILFFVPAAYGAIAASCLLWSLGAKVGDAAQLALYGGVAILGYSFLHGCGYVALSRAYVRRLLASVGLMAPSDSGRGTARLGRRAAVGRRRHC